MHHRILTTIECYKSDEWTENQQKTEASIINALFQEMRVEHTFSLMSLLLNVQFFCHQNKM